MKLDRLRRSGVGSILTALPFVLSPASAATVNFAHDIAPIIYRNCAPCHRPGEAGPFPLLSYQDVKSHARQIADVTRRRYMPPWAPQAGYGEFLDERRLTDAEIRLIADWASQGAPEGNAAETPPLPKFTDGWQLGPPDLIIEAEHAHTLPASGPDMFWNFILPARVASTRYVRAIEIRPGNKRIVHHANLLVDHTGWARRQGNGTGDGFPGMDPTNERTVFEPDDGHFLFWKPGGSTYVEPDGFAWKIDPGNDLVLNTHMQPTGKSEQVRPSVGLYFTDKPPQHFPMLVQLEHDGALDIPAGEPDFRVSDDFRMPLDADVLAVYPHAHYLGTLLEGFATLPDGTRKELIRIADWDPAWQGVYHYREPVFLPKGSVVSMRYHYDNSAANPRNPNSPPKRVVGGDQATDEMGHLWLQVLPRGDGDRRRELAEAMVRHRLEKYPEDLPAHLQLGALLLARSDGVEALQIGESAVRLQADNVEAHKLLGAALAAVGRGREAAAEFQSALRLKPDDFDARFNLASALVKMGKLDEASKILRSTKAAANPSAVGYDSVGCAVHVDPARFNRPGLTELTWKSDILEFSDTPADANPFKLHVDSMYVRFTGRGFGLSDRNPGLTLAAVIQNAGHSFADDAVSRILPFRGLGVYLSSLQPTLSDQQHGVRLNAATTAFPNFGRFFENVNGLGYSAKNIYSRQTLGTPSPDKPISIRWIVRKLETTTNPPPNLSKNLAGEWISLSGTFVRWNFQMAVNGAMIDVGDYYLPLEKAEFISAQDPLSLVPEHFGSAAQILRSQPSTVRFSDLAAFDGANWSSLADWRLTNCLDDGAGNLDQHYGWRTDGGALIDTSGHADDLRSSTRAIAASFHLAAPDPAGK